MTAVMDIFKDYQQFKYPNIVAEQIETCVTVAICCSWAGVTRNLWDEIMRGGDDFNIQEVFELRGHFRAVSPIKISYLASPQISTVSPGTHKGRLRLLALQARILSMKSFLESCTLSDIGGYYQDRVDQANRTYESLVAGQAVTYAAYRHAIANAANIPRSLQAVQPRPRRDVAAKEARG